MKKLIIGFFAGVGVFTLLAFTAIDYTPTKRTAEVNQEQGVLIFMDCYPVLPIEELGAIKSGSWTGMYEEVKPKLVKKAKKEYPDCQGIIIGGGNAARCTVFKFKEE
ncbi:MAG: hypothetical protein LBS50_09985 [Prevotellaceae bacterium]|jgi:hypothetical protein|nr:hypothetical protein [Prevotellaceae bacterium]